MKLSIALAALASVVLIPVAAAAGSLTYTAKSDIVGVTSTATLAGGGNPAFFAQGPNYNGVVSLIMDEGSAGKFICSGTLLPDRMSILTAGHCVSHGAGTANPISTTAYFTDTSNPDSVTYLDPASTAVTVSQYFVNPLYTGEVIDQNDIAVLRLSQAAPSFAVAHQIDFGGDLTGQNFNVAGYGVRSDVGGNVGGDLGPGRLRQGNNTYDFRLDDPAFGGVWLDILLGPGNCDPTLACTADARYTYLSDFDNGNPANDASCVLNNAIFGTITNPWCNLGLGASEVSVAGGDSGGPEFINGRIASITSFGLTFGAPYGDIDGALNETFGEFNGFVPTYIHAQFIHDSMVPEPATWAMMIVGIGAIGYALRRRTVKFGAAA